MFELRQLDVFDREIEDISGPLGCEFFVSLRRAAKSALSEDRIQEIRTRFLQDHLLEDLRNNGHLANDGGLLDLAKKGGGLELARLEGKISRLWN